MKVKITLSPYALKSGRVVEAACRAFGKAFRRYANCARPVDVTCSSQQLVCFQVERNALGATNSWKDLQVRVLEPEPLPLCYDATFAVSIETAARLARRELRASLTRAPSRIVAAREETFAEVPGHPVLPTYRDPFYPCPDLFFQPYDPRRDPSHPRYDPAWDPKYAFEPEPDPAYHHLGAEAEHHTSCAKVG